MTVKPNLVLEKEPASNTLYWGSMLSIYMFPMGISIGASRRILSLTLAEQLTQMKIAHMSCAGVYCTFEDYVCGMGTQT